MKAILINSINRTIVETEVSGLESMQNAVGGMIEVALDPDENNTIYVDEEGLMKNYPMWFTYEGGHQPFAGNGLVVGIDNTTGESCSCTLTVEDITNKVKFLTPLEVAVMTR